uniref:Uncharacterized protein n=1 Tax=Trypanosoma vivax (strain Y486) TaxID=1055687 RepID=G0UBV7_TRYVY|nr:hypothetical protein, unlikely [Trypanosoma vivax Y486]
MSTKTLNTQSLTHQAPAQHKQHQHHHHNNNITGKQPVAPSRAWPPCFAVVQPASRSRRNTMMNCKKNVYYDLGKVVQNVLVNSFFFFFFFFLLFFVFCIFILYPNAAHSFYCTVLCNCVPEISSHPF